MSYDRNPRRRGDVAITLLHIYHDQGGANGESDDERISTRKQRVNLTPYPEVVNYLIHTYGTDELIAEADGEIKQFRQRSRMVHSQYSKGSWTNEHKCGTVYTEDGLKGIFIEGLHETIRESARNFGEYKGNADLQERECNEKSV